MFSLSSEREAGVLRASGKAVWTWPPVGAVDAGRYGRTHININPALDGTIGGNSGNFKPSPQGTIGASGNGPSEDSKPSQAGSIEREAMSAIPSPEGTFEAPIPRETKEERIATAIAASGNGVAELDARERRALEYLEYTCDNRLMSVGFVCMTVALYENCDGNLPMPGILASKIIDECLAEQRACKAADESPVKFCYPVGFRAHRNALRKREKAARRECAATEAV